MSRPAPHLGSTHPLAEVAASHCNAGHTGPFLGRLACGACWERAIRDDERVAVEFGLPRAVDPDPTYVDEMAVRLACRGERVTLTDAERVAAIRHMASTGLTSTSIAYRLRVPPPLVDAVLNPSSTPEPVVATTARTRTDLPLAA